MAEIEKSIVVAVPLSTAYNQWTQFESFPEFMDGVLAVEQLDDRSLRWRVNVAGRVTEWDAVITQQVPDDRIGWRSTVGATNAGNVRFEAVGPDATRIHLHILYAPEGVVESAADALGFVSRRVEGDLSRFKEFIESRSTATGAWRGEIHAPSPSGTSNPKA